MLDFIGNGLRTSLRGIQQHTHCPNSSGRLEEWELYRKSISPPASPVPVAVTLDDNGKHVVPSDDLNSLTATHRVGQPWRDARLSPQVPPGGGSPPCRHRRQKSQWHYRSIDWDVFEKCNYGQCLKSVFVPVLFGAVSTSNAHTVSRCAPWHTLQELTTLGASTPAK